MTTSVETKDIVPLFEIKNVFNDINNSFLSFGVHEEDNTKHQNRDKLSEMPLHKALYKNSRKLDNAQLLMKLSKGFGFNINVGHKVYAMQAPPRPIIEPMVDELMANYGNQYLEDVLEEQLGFSNKKGTYKAFNELAKNLDETRIKAFIYRNYSGGNNIYTAGVKQNESRNGAKIKNIYNSKNKSINYANLWKDFDGSGDTPLIDSEDLIKSIKTKVGG